ncbi:methyltransferase, partial [Nocardiopsis tropica]|nr:methyltransferase [Nocardiopsis tropica]
MSETEFPRGLADRLRGILIDADYTVSGVRDRLGDAAARALAREELVPALRATGGEERLGLLLRLWWLRSPIPARAARAVLPVDELAEAGLVTVEEGPHGTVVRALVHLGPWDLEDGRPGFVVSDPKVRPGTGAVPRHDHVVGAGNASATLSQLIVDGPVDRALDVGTGCGVQALHLASRARAVVATDLNPRAVRLAGISLALSGVAGARLAQGA